MTFGKLGHPLTFGLWFRAAGPDIFDLSVPTQPHTLITGATGAVGLCLAHLLANKMPLLLHGRDEKKLTSLLEQLSGTHSHEYWNYDLENVDSLSSSLETTLQRKSIAVGGFIHCAGVSIVLPARGAPLAAMRTSLNVNCVSAQQIVASLLKKRSNAATLRSIVFISSISSRVGVRGHSMYCASKAALDGLMRALAVELAPETRVNSILPGTLDTVMAAEALGDPQIAMNIKSDYPLGIGKPEDITNMVQFLLSDSARWLTGQELVIDGGCTVNFSLK